MAWDSKIFCITREEVNPFVYPSAHPFIHLLSGNPSAIHSLTDSHPSTHPFIDLPVIIHLPTCPPIHQYTHPPTSHPFIYQFIHLPSIHSIINLFIIIHIAIIHPNINSSPYPSIQTSVRPPTHHPIAHESIHSFIMYLSIYPPDHPASIWPLFIYSSILPVKKPDI